MLSRVADSLYWMARYLERAEHTSRLIAVKLESMIEQSTEDAETSWARVAVALSTEGAAAEAGDIFAITQRLAFDRDNPSSLLSSLRLARDNARQVREQLSTEVWEHLNRLYLRLQPVTIESTWVHQPARVFRESLEELQTLEGVTFSTLRHGEGWHFLELGRYIERAQLVSRLLDIHFGVDCARLRGAAAAAEISRLAGALEILHGVRALLQRIHCCDQAGAHRGVSCCSIRSFPIRSNSPSTGYMKRLARVAPGAPPSRRAACERLAGTPQGGRRFRPDRRVDRRHDRRFLVGDHPSMRADPRSRLCSLYRLWRGDRAVTCGDV